MSSLTMKKLPATKAWPAAPVARRTLGEKLVLAAGSGAVAAGMAGAPEDVQAALMSSASVPISPPSSFGETPWDVDGDGTSDFRIRNINNAVYSLAALDDANGGRLVVPVGAATDGISKLPLGATIGTGLAAAYKFHTAAQGVNSLTNMGGIAFDAGNSGWAIGDTGFFGFKFTNSSGTHFGWGELSMFGDAASPGDGYSILRAFYETTPNAPVRAGVTTTSVPEPSSLGLLALGAAGLVAWRRRRGEAAAGP